MTKNFFYIDTHGPDKKAIREAIAKAAELANNDTEIGNVIFLIHTKNNMVWFDDIFSKKQQRELLKGTSFPDCKAIFKIETMRTYNDTGTLSELLITFGLKGEDVLKFDNYYSVKAVIAIPWLKDELQKWIQTRNPLELRSNSQTRTPSYVSTHSCSKS